MSNLFNKVACFTDIHFGKKNNSNVFSQDCIRFIDWFIKNSKEFGAETCIFCGDWHNQRTNFNINIFSSYSIEAIQKLVDNFEKVIFIIGNHDMYYKNNRRDVNIMKYTSIYPNVLVVNEPMVVGDVALVPWLIENEHETISQMQCKYMFGHFELPTFLMNERMEMPDEGDGINLGMLSIPEYVFTGHFHIRQRKNNVIYIGSPFGHDYSDSWDDERGCMFMEWGNDPQFLNWKAGPRYRTGTLSKMLANQDDFIKQRNYLKIELDVDITYEERTHILETIEPQVREIQLIPKPKTEHQSTTIDLSNFKGVDETVMAVISEVDTTYSKKMLIEEYNSI